MPITTALVTGATRGIGRALVKQLTERGVRVFVSGRDPELLAALQRETGCAGLCADLADPAQVVNLYAEAKAVLGVPDALINNAAFNSRKVPLAETTLDEFDAQYAVNLRAPYLLCREAMKDMIPRRSGHIVNVISTCALYANETMGIYTAMKCGLRGLTGVLIKEGRPHQIKVTAVFPGGVDTEFRKQRRPDYMKPESVATMIADVLFAPDDVVVHELTFRPLVETNF